MGIGSIAGIALLFGLRLLWTSALPMSDCDEIHNYWEPLHLLLFGSGKQTWEYHPSFALRSWFFVWIYGAPAYLLLFFKEFSMLLNFGTSNLTFWNSIDKPALFSAVKLVSGCISAAVDYYMIGGIQLRFGFFASRIALILCAFSTGITQAGSSFLPSSFAMICMSAAAGAWMRLTATSQVRDIIFADPSSSTTARGNPTARQRQSLKGKNANTPATVWRLFGNDLIIGLTAVCLAAIVGWPFCLLIAAPIALSVVYHAGILVPAALALFISGALCTIVAGLDSFYYGSLVLSTWNIVKYNVFGKEGRGSHLYGVEPWHFFFQNLFLNFNLVFLVALFSPGIVWLFRHRARALGITPLHALIHSSPFFLWFTFWLVVPHKEERFMAPAYPFIIIAASTALASLMAPAPSRDNAPSGAGEDSNKGAKKTKAKDSDDENDASAPLQTEAAERRRRKERRMNVFGFLGLFILWLFGLLSTARTAGLWHFYGGAETSAKKLHDYIVSHGGEGASPDILVCMGKEWYKYPGSFFLPEPTTPFRSVESSVAAFPSFVRLYSAFGGNDPRASAIGGAEVRKAIDSVLPLNRTVRFGFLETTSFKGALPKDWQPKNPSRIEELTRYTRSEFNDLNQPNPSQWVSDPDKHCDFYYDSSLGAEDPLRTEKNRGDVWALIPELTYPVLNKELTPFWCRLVFVPGFSKHCAIYGSMGVFKNKLRGW